MTYQCRENGAKFYTNMTCAARKAQAKRYPNDIRFAACRDCPGPKRIEGEHAKLSSPDTEIRTKRAGWHSTYHKKTLSKMGDMWPEDQAGIRRDTPNPTPLPDLSGPGRKKEADQKKNKPVVGSAGSGQSNKSRGKRRSTRKAAVMVALGELLRKRNWRLKRTIRSADFDTARLAAQDVAALADIIIAMVEKR